MNSKIKSRIVSLLLTLLILGFLEVVSSSLLPSIGFSNFRLSFNILIILYLCFRLSSAYLAIYILIVQFSHGAFSIEGWALGTFVGIIISILAGYLKDFIDLSTNVTTMIATEVFLIAWFVIEGIIFFVKHQDFFFMWKKTWHFLPESIVLCLLSPFVFTVMEKIWKSEDANSLGSIN